MRALMALIVGFALGCTTALDAVTTVNDAVEAGAPLTLDEPTCEASQAVLDAIRLRDIELRKQLPSLAQNDRQAVIGQLLGMEALRAAVLNWRREHDCNPV